jgi:hypothetical protein
MPPLGQGLGVFVPSSTRVPSLGINPLYAQKTLNSLENFPNGLSEKKAFCSANRKTMRAFERPVSIGAARLIRHLDDYENV